MRDLELASLRAWPGIEEESLGGWTLRFSDGFTGRANSVQPLAGSDRPIGERVAACERWYAERERPCIFRITPFSEPGVLACLADRGYAWVNPTDVMRLDSLESVAGRTGAALRKSAPSEWLDTFARLHGLAGPHPAMGAIIARIGPPSLLGVLWAEDRPVGCGLAVADGEWVGLFDLVVDPEQRRRGYGADMVRRLCAWGRERGARSAYLQVTRDNTAAAALYRRLGFRHAYEYSYRLPSTALDERRS